MRKFILAASFCVLAYTMCQTVTLGQPISSYPTPPTVTCDGTKAATIKCPVAMPPGHFESLECQGERTGSLGCAHTFAYAQDTFGCSAAEVNTTTTPPSYTSLCVDTNEITNCTIRKKCTSVQRTRMTGPGMFEIYTECITGMPEPTYRYKKGNITNLTTPDSCQQYVSP